MPAMSDRRPLICTVDKDDHYRCGQFSLKCFICTIKIYDTEKEYLFTNVNTDILNVLFICVHAWDTQ